MSFFSFPFFKDGYRFFFAYFSNKKNVKRHASIYCYLISSESQYTACFTWLFTCASVYRKKTKRCVPNLFALSSLYVNHPLSVWVGEDKLFFFVPKARNLYREWNEDYNLSKMKWRLDESIYIKECIEIVESIYKIRYLERCHHWYQPWQRMISI